MLSLGWLLPASVAAGLLEDVVCVFTGCYSGNCAVLCSECTGPEALSCTKCVAEAVLTHDGCVCGDGTFPQGNVCTTCHPSCVTCSGERETQCESCRTRMTLVGGRCECPAGEYWGAKGCQACHGTCKTCYGPSKFHCTTCLAAASLHNSRCVCTTGFYANPHAGNCTACHASCVSCSGPQSNQCRECQPHALLSAGMCMCKEGFYHRNETDCLGCHATCRSCSGPLASQCLECRPGALNWAGECACAQGYFPSPDATVCRPCLSTCPATGHCFHPSQKLTKRMETPSAVQRKVAEVLCRLENTYITDAPSLSEVFAVDIMEFPSIYGPALILLLHSRSTSVFSKGLELLHSGFSQAFNETVIIFTQPKKHEGRSTGDDYSPGNTSILSLDNWAMVQDLVYPYQVLRRFVIAEEDGSHVQVVELCREAEATIGPKKLLLEAVYFALAGKRIRIVFA